MIEVGMQDGVCLLVGGVGCLDGLEQGYYVWFMIFFDVYIDMVIVQEEIFGFVLVILFYDIVEEVIVIVNDIVYGLGVYVQGIDKDQVCVVVVCIKFGQVYLNYLVWDLQVFFGGYKQFGNGCEYGVEGMEEYMEVKLILGYYV